MSSYLAAWIAVQVLHAFLLAFVLIALTWTRMPSLLRKPGLVLGASLLPMQILCGFNCPLTLLSDWLLIQDGTPSDTRFFKHSFVVDALAGVGVAVPVSLIIVATAVVSVVSWLALRARRVCNR